MYDLADLTPQCGRRPDALKFFLSWQYHGSSGLRDLVEGAFATAQYMADTLRQRPESFELVSPAKLPCTQVCFYYTGGEKGEAAQNNEQERTQMTQEIVRQLVDRGFMTDFAPGPNGKMLRVVVGVYTRKETVDALIRSVAEIGSDL